MLARAPSPSSSFLTFSLYWIRLLQFDAWSQVCVWEGLWLLLCLQLAYLPGQVEETLPYVVVVLGTRFEEQHVVELGVSLWGGGGGGERGTERESRGAGGRCCVIVECLQPERLGRVQGEEGRAVSNLCL